MCNIQQSKNPPLPTRHFHFSITMLPLQQPWERKAAYDKGYAKGLAASEPGRMIAVNVNISGLPTSSDTPRRTTFTIRQDTQIRDILTEIHRRLPQLEDQQHPFTIATAGANSRELLSTADCEVMELLQPWDAAFLNLRVNVTVPKKPGEEAKQGGLGSRLRKALGGKDGGSAQVAQDGSERSSVRSAPPPYEEVARSVP